MAKKASPKRYAQAVFEIAREQNTLDQWLADLSTIAGLTADAEVLAALRNPRIRFDGKVKLLREALAGTSPLALNLAYLLVSRDSLGSLPEIAKEYQKLVNDYRGVASAEVTTAVPLEEPDKKKLQERLSAITGKQVVIGTKVDPGIIGGVVARVGDRLLDGSTRSRLLALKQKMARQ